MIAMFRLQKALVRTMADQVALSGIVKYGVGPAVSLECAIVAARQRLHDRRFDQFPRYCPAENCLVIIRVHVPKSEPLVPHFCQHSSFVRRINVAIIVVDDDGYSRSRW